MMSNDGEVVTRIGQEKYRTEIVAGGQTLVVDEPADVGGGGDAPTPYDLLLGSIGACTAMTLRMYARRKGWPLEHVRVVVGHSRKPASAPPDHFSRELDLVGPLDEEQRSALRAIADRCPVHRTLHGGAVVVTADAAHPTGLPQAESPLQHALDVEEI